ncbi:hypothetical protein FDI76_gp178 [Serratia phage vB_Sru_IME250]|uniref:Uncharacterized protein n=1 Tax=Serratia phage vB_Sru_IME250 TaxID=1852640 RepID=A0A1J0MFZ3_9CAUD|nr:hypothetical protein FDI76_gp178 [Serratia phage vB_Sru_IME250]ANM47217.1 hypothetical protein [Serratia phage vB_Sru_IME250]APD20125.1 hypothetical protein [Serratia phage vB_Sru_IME250]
MTAPNSNYFDVKGILTAAIASLLVSTATFVWFMGGLENRVNVLEKDSGKVDQILIKVNDLSEKFAVMNNDISYVKQNMTELKLNSSSLSDDVRTLRLTVSDLQRKENGNGR